jgi:hypothetical protein
MHEIRACLPAEHVATAARLANEAGIAAAGALVAAVQEGPIHFTAFKGSLASFAVSAVIGITAGLSNADDTGRRYLIGVASAVQLAIFPSGWGPRLFWACPTASPGRASKAS